MNGLHLYAILGSDPGPFEVAGLDSASVRAIYAGTVWALVSEDSSSSDKNTVQDVLAPVTHDAVVREFLERGPILPARYGASVPEPVLLERLEAMGANLRAALETIGDAREFAVRLELPSTKPAPKPQTAPRSGRAYLEMRRTAFITEDARRAELEAIADDLEVSLAPLARATRRTLTTDLYRGSFLVPLAMLTAFPDAFAGAVARLQLSPAPSLHGPFAPYSFTDAPEGAPTTGGNA